MPHKRNLFLTAIIVAVAASSLLAAGEADSNDIWRDASRSGVNSAYLLIGLGNMTVDYRRVLDEYENNNADLDDDSTTLLTIHATCASVGLDTSMLQLTSNELCHQLPAIVHLEQDSAERFSQVGRGTFSVVTEITPTTVTFVDGSDGTLYEMSLDEFTRSWTGYCVAIRAPTKVRKLIAIFAISNCIGLLFLVRHK